MYDQTVRRFTHILLASQIVVFTVLYMNSLESPIKLKKILPKEINKIEFGVNMKAFLKARPNAKMQDQPHTFRHVFQEEFSSGKITSIVYYFDADIDDNPLYEIIVNYRDEATMELQANILLGPTNYSGKNGQSKEWKFDINEDLPVHCWVFKNKVIYAMPLLGTEWNTAGEIDL